MTNIAADQIKKVYVIVSTELENERIIVVCSTLQIAEEKMAKMKIENVSLAKKMNVENAHWAKNKNLEIEVYAMDEVSA